MIKCPKCSNRFTALNEEKGRKEKEPFRIETEEPKQFQEKMAQAGVEAESKQAQVVKTESELLPEKETEEYALYQYKKSRSRAILLLPIGFAWVLVPIFLAAFLPRSVGGPLVGIGVFIFISGCYYYAKAKGYHGAWGILGWLGPLGFLPLAFFPDKHKDRALRKMSNALVVLTVLFFLLVVAAGALIPVLLPSRKARVTTSDSKWVDPLDRLTSAQKHRVSQIVTGVIENPEYLTPKVHSEFWTLMRILGPCTSSYISQVREAMAGTAIYQRYFWEDALWAVENGRPLKSLQREKCEKRLLQLDIGGVIEWRIRQNELVMEKIAQREAITYEGTTVVLDKQIIEWILNNIGAMVSREDRDLDKLFTPPSQ
jgi:hypothetical protein